MNATQTNLIGLIGTLTRKRISAPHGEHGERFLAAGRYAAVGAAPYRNTGHPAGYSGGPKWTETPPLDAPPIP
jgi:hypothetical protein